MKQEMLELTTIATRDTTDLKDKKEEEGERQMNLKQPSAPTAVSSKTRMYHKNASGWTSKIDIAKYPANQYSRTIASLGSN